MGRLGRVPLIVTANGLRAPANSGARMRPKVGVMTSFDYNSSLCERELGSNYNTIA